VPVRNFPNSCKKSFVTIFLLICCRVFAGTDYAKEGEEFARKQLEESKSLNLEKTFESIKDLEMRIRSIPIGEGKGCKDCGSEVRNIRPQEADEENGLLVFVSFSMPDASLKQLSDQSEKYGAILIMRGIHEGSFSKMKDKILSVDKGGLKFCIDPALFQKYDIRAAPVFVLVKDGKEINRLSGNVDLEFASSKLEEE
jgi:conjugal transfer pilus assembly protein TrbC